MHSSSFPSLNSPRDEEVCRTFVGDTVPPMRGIFVRAKKWHLPGKGRAIAGVWSQLKYTQNLCKGITVLPLKTFSRKCVPPPVTTHIHIGFSATDFSGLHDTAFWDFRTQNLYYRLGPFQREFFLNDFTGVIVKTAFKSLGSTKMLLALQSTKEKIGLTPIFQLKKSLGAIIFLPLTGIFFSIKCKLSSIVRPSAFMEHLIKL